MQWNGTLSEPSHLWVAVRCCWSQTAQSFVWRAQPPETKTMNKPHFRSQRCRRSRKILHQYQLFFSLHTMLGETFVLKQKKTRDQSDVWVCFYHPSFLSVLFAVTPCNPSLLFSLGLWISPFSWPTPCHPIVVSAQSGVRSVAPCVSKIPAGPKDSCTNLDWKKQWKQRRQGWIKKMRK